MSEKVLVIDDDPAILELVKVNLEIHGYQVITAEDAIKGLALNSQENPNLIVLDLMMPKLDGYSACQQIRADHKHNRNVPILMLTAMSRIDDKIAGFDAGSDDYLTKPFEVGELIARVKALLRRSARLQSSSDAPSTPNEILHSGEITLIPESREAQISGRLVRFTPIEFEILYCLMQNIGKTVSPSQLLHDIWGYSPDDDIETIRVHIRHLRQRLEEEGAKQDSSDSFSQKPRRFIRTIYGKGYQLIPEGFTDD
ncbi:MAG: response regulator transcription factor [Candidatus Caenarcaniphilales bacterium]|nr:response regulator transcription factor [Candidatus Caenarcaniphilales bacterium]